MTFEELRAAFKKRMVQAFDETSDMRERIKDAFFSEKYKEHNTKIFDSMVALTKREILNLIDTFDENIDDTNVLVPFRKLCVGIEFIILNAVMTTLENVFQEETEGLHGVVRIFSAMMHAYVDGYLNSVVDSFTRYYKDGKEVKLEFISTIRSSDDFTSKSSLSDALKCYKELRQGKDPQEYKLSKISIDSLPEELFSNEDRRKSNVVTFPKKGKPNDK